MDWQDLLLAIRSGNCIKGCRRMLSHEEIDRIQHILLDITRAGLESKGTFLSTDIAHSYIFSVAKGLICAQHSHESPGLTPAVLASLIMKRIEVVVQHSKSREISDFTKLACVMFPGAVDFFRRSMRDCTRETHTARRPLHDDCLICLQNMGDMQGVEDFTVWCKSCGHSYHRDCFNAWMGSLDFETEVTCVHCRAFWPLHCQHEYDLPEEVAAMLLDTQSTDRVALETGHRPESQESAHANIECMAETEMLDMITERVRTDVVLDLETKMAELIEENTQLRADQQRTKEITEGMADKAVAIIDEVSKFISENEKLMDENSILAQRNKELEDSRAADGEMRAKLTKQNVQLTEQIIELREEITLRRAEADEGCYERDSAKRDIVNIERQRDVLECENAALTAKIAALLTKVNCHSPRQAAESSTGPA